MVKDLEKGGKKVVATNKIARGDLILEEKPIMKETLCAEASDAEESNRDSPALASYKKKFDCLSPD